MISQPKKILYIFYRLYFRYRWLIALRGSEVLVEDGGEWKKNKKCAASFPFPRRFFQLLRSTTLRLAWYARGELPLDGSAILRRTSKLRRTSSPSSTRTVSSFPFGNSASTKDSHSIYIMYFFKVKTFLRAVGGLFRWTSAYAYAYAYGRAGRRERGYGEVAAVGGRAGVYESGKRGGTVQQQQ